MKRITLTILAASALLVLPGCDLFDGKTTSPFTGKPATRDEIASEAKAATSAEIAKFKAEAEEAALKAATRKAEFDRAVATLDAKTRIELATLQATYEIQATDTANRISQIQAAGERAVTLIQDRLESANAALDREAEQASMLFGVAGQGASMIPVYGTAVAGLLGTIGAAVAGNYRGRKKGEDKGWDDAKADGAKAVAERDAHYDMGKAEATVAALLETLIKKGA